jgi:hypothetical protein
MEQIIIIIIITIIRMFIYSCANLIAQRPITMLAPVRRKKQQNTNKIQKKTDYVIVVVIIIIIISLKTNLSQEVRKVSIYKVYSIMRREKLYTYTYMYTDK